MKSSKNSNSNFKTAEIVIPFNSPIKLKIGDGEPECQSISNLLASSLECT
jgi:hypothetical protein